jgi:small-conductance mechanosensitive channel
MMEWQEALITAGSVIAVLVIVWAVWKVAGKRLPEKLRDMIDQVLPVLYLAVLVVTALVIIDPDQADLLLESALRYLPQGLVALIVVILARALGKIVGTLIEAAFTRMSAVIAARARMAASSLILGIGIIIALQQIGISTDIILLLIGALAFGAALAGGLAIGLGSVPVARQVAAGRHIQNRYEEGQMVRVGIVEGRIVDIGMASTRVEGIDGGVIAIPNEQFLDGPVTIL